MPGGGVVVERPSIRGLLLLLSPLLVLLQTFALLEEK